jgi:hypothetical protein
MVTATVLVIIFAPLFFVIIETFLGKGRKGGTAAFIGGHPSVAALKERLSGIREWLSGKRGNAEPTVTGDGTPPEDH